MCPITAEEDYLVQEARLRGATPAVRGVINPDGTPTEISASQIINPGTLSSAIPLDFQGIQLKNHALLVNNRSADWIPGKPLLPGAADDKIRIDHGFKLTDDSFSWISLFTGIITDYSKIQDAWKKPHNAFIESSSIISENLKKKIGVPATDGTRQPFMHGPYLANTEVKETTDPYVSSITKSGSGSSTLCVLNADEFSGDTDIQFKLQAETTGEIDTATFKFSTDGGLSWEKTGIVARSITEPITLTESLKVYWISGSGNDLVADDYWTFTAYAKTTTYLIPGYPFEEISSLFLNGTEIFTGFTKDEATGKIVLKGNSGSLKVRIIKDFLTNPVDIIQDILAEIGLDSYLNELSFSQAKDDTLAYSIGVRFENMTATKALQLITQNLLYFFWVDEDQIYLQAFTGTL